MSTHFICFHGEIKIFYLDTPLVWSCDYISAAYRNGFSEMGHTVFDLITARTPISAQSSNSMVFRLQPVYFLSTSL